MVLLNRTEEEIPVYLRLGEYCAELTSKAKSIMTAEIDTMMFGRQIAGLSFVYSILLTFLFSGIVNVGMHVTLKKINMVESLKSVE